VRDEIKVVAMNQDILKLAAERMRQEFPLGFPCANRIEYLACFANIEEWTDRVSKSLETQSVGHIVKIDMPKPGWLSRPMQVITADDMLAYNYVILCLLPEVRKRIEWSQRTIRLSHHLNNQGSKRWFPPWGNLHGWRNFQKVSIGKAYSGEHEYVVCTDISSYYENISIPLLSNMLRATDADKKHIQLLTKLLSEFAGIRDKGIPQGYSASHVLGEFYLNTIDHFLETAGVVHLRYLDDYRLFCSSEIEARLHLKLLNSKIREVGLNIHSGKTEILNVSKAMNKFKALRLRLNGASSAIGKRLVAFENASFISAEEITKYFQDVDPADQPEDVILEAWEDFLTKEFDKTLFHFLLSRLKALDSPVALSFCLEILHSMPHETTHCLNYFSHFRAKLPSLKPNLARDLELIITSSETIYQFQQWQIFDWFLRNEIQSQALIEFSRSVLNGEEKADALMPVAIAYLGQFSEGDHDFSRLQDVLSRETREPVIASISHALSHGPSSLFKGAIKRKFEHMPLVKWAYALTPKAYIDPI